jgi:hypothetical protein
LVLNNRTIGVSYWITLLGVLFKRWMAEMKASSQNFKGIDA